MQIWFKEENEINKYIIIGKYKSYLCTIEGIKIIDNPNLVIKNEGYKNIIIHKNFKILDMYKKKNVYLFLSNDRMEIVKYDKSIDMQIIV